MRSIVRMDLNQDTSCGQHKGTHLLRPEPQQADVRIDCLLYGHDGGASPGCRRHFGGKVWIEGSKKQYCSCKNR